VGRVSLATHKIKFVWSDKITLLLQVLQSVAPVFALASIGFAWVKMGFEYRVEFVTRLAMTLSIPCLIFMALVKTEIDPAVLTDTALATIAAYAAVGALVFAFVALLGLDRRTYLAPLTFGNTGNLGLPLALFAFGAQGFDIAVVVFAIMAFMSFTIGVWLVSGAGSGWVAIKEPMVAATVLGALFLWQGWALPVWIGNTLDLIGQIGIPVMLLTLGVAISRLKPQRLLSALLLSLAKLAICVGAAYGVGLIFQLPNLALGVLVLQVATPVAVTNYMLAEKYKANADEVAGLVVVSTLLSVIAIPLILGAFLADPAL